MQHDLFKETPQTLTNAERQRAHRERQALLGRKAVTRLLTEDEAFYLSRVLETMRKTGGLPCTARHPLTGRFIHIDT